MKRATIYSIAIIFFVFSNISCDKVLKVKPENIISSEQVFSTKKSVEAYFATLYDGMPLEDFNFHAVNPNDVFHSYTTGRPSVLSGLSVENSFHNVRSIPGDGTWWAWWDDGYGTIRDVNKFIANVKKSDFSEDQINQWLGEAMFIRAFDYFGLVKRYGGVPLITKVQNYTGDNLTELQVPRDKEKKIYDFISTQLDSAATLMSPTSPAGQANKYVALALKSRAMLFAASEAEYAPVQLNGLVGIPSKYADQYWKQAYNAAQKVIESGKYSLYNKYPNNPIKNFQQLFLHAENNPEVILAKYYQYPKKAHEFDLWRLPYEYESPDGYSSDDAPSLQLVEAFNYIDGSNGKLKIKNSQGKRIEYKDPLGIFKNKDPRLFASVILPNSKWRGKVVHVRAGIITPSGKTLTTGSYDDLYKGMHIIGASGIGGGEVSLSGFYMRKHMNPAYSASEVSGGTSTQPWIAFRLGGILLNYAEAATELGRTADAAKAINKIHKRAGMSLVKPSQVTIKTVRHERKVELFGESKYYWDMRRWHIIDEVLNNYYVEALYPYYVYPDKAYIFKRVKVGYPYTFYPKMYYTKVPEEEINKNPNLEQNPGY